MATIDKRYIPSYNNFVASSKAIRSKVSPEEWNNLWNIISNQVDDTTEQLKKIHDFLTGGGTVSELLSLPGGAASILEAIENVHAPLQTSVDQPENPAPDTIWLQITNP